MPDCPSCGVTLPEPEPDWDVTFEAPISLNGETFEMSKLSFRERKTMRALLAEIVKLDNPDADPDEDWVGDDLRVAFAIVCARRANPAFSIEDGLNLVSDDLRPPDPPTKRAAKPRAVKAA